MTSLRSLVAVLFVSFIAGTTAFVPQSHNKAASSATTLNMKFLKDLGFEKPSWLPDFGGKKEKEEEAPSEETEEAATETEDTEAAKED